MQQYDRRLPAMNIGRFMIFMLLVAVLGVPFALRPAQERSASGENVPSVVIVTPHVPQIRREFTEAFDRWHQRKFGTPVRVDWRVPGGTSEIIKQLEGQYHAAAAMGLIDFSEPKDPKIAPNVMSIDIMFGGGSYEHTRLKTGIKFKESGADKGERTIPLSIPAGFTQQQLDDWYGVNKIGSGFLYDPDQYWMGTALSAFGIVYNEDMFRKVFPDREQPFPQSFDDLADPKLIGLITLADPRQSGSVTTTFEAILNFYGWEKGWKLLREMCANTRSFTNSSPKTPLDVAQGEAAAGLTIDFTVAARRRRSSSPVTMRTRVASAMWIPRAAHTSMRIRSAFCAARRISKSRNDSSNLRSPMTRRHCGSFTPSIIPRPSHIRKMRMV